MAILENFEDGTVDDFYDATVGDGWSVNANNRTSGFAQPRFRPLPDPVNGIPAAAPGTTQGLRFIGSSAWALAIDYAESSGLGGYFYSDSGGAGGFSSVAMSVAIGFTASAALGSITVERRGNTLHLTEFYDDGDTYVSNETSVELSDFIPDANTGAVWFEISFRKGAGWYVRNAMSGATLASSGYPWAIPAGASWELFYAPNASGPSGPSGSVSGAVDDLYGWSGATGPAVRLYPRDDARGSGSAPRLQPTTKNVRLVGDIP